MLGPKFFQLIWHYKSDLFFASVQISQLCTVIYPICFDTRSKFSNYAIINHIQFTSLVMRHLQKKTCMVTHNFFTLIVIDY